LLRARTPEFNETRLPRSPSPASIFTPRPGTPPWLVPLVQSAGDWEEHRRPKPTAALRSSSHPLLLLLETIEPSIVTIGFPSPRRSP
jgi:hypothetical protein